MFVCTRMVYGKKAGADGCGLASCVGDAEDGLVLPLWVADLGYNWLYFCGDA